MGKHHREHACHLHVIMHRYWYLLSLLIVLAGIVGIAIGAARGEAYIVLKKATIVCLECIGLG